MDITIETTVNAPLARVWQAWITPADIMQWNFASDDWMCPAAHIDFTVGGKFSYRMEARDGSMGFDFSGTFTAIEVHQRIELLLDDDRKVSVSFNESDQGTSVVETFETENTFPKEQQRLGWQAILNNFRKHVERHNT